jgi:L-asparagine transporter-like permease
MIELPVVEVKPFDIWSFVCLGYSIILSSGVAWILYNNISMEQGRPWLLTTGAGFLLCMTMVWVILLRTSVTRETQYTETKERHESIDWQLATKTCAQAFFVATVLVTFTPGRLDKSITTILTGVLQAVRLASIFYLVRSRNQDRNDEHG